ncbi:STAS domain-containing protein [Clostridium sp. WILCCON 0269]|uniref:STAS domain-containing protein n=1 Tax=Candidatus Clostridium eludens TaxID=3381663 RepID=A0ABW8SKC4_9CLOT
MNKVPILRLKDTLIVAFQGELTDTSAVCFQNDLLEKIYSTKAKGVVIDISVLDIVDSFLGRTISDTACMIKLLGAELILVGMKPSVAITLIELGLSISKVTTALDLDTGMEKLNALIKLNEIQEIDYVQLTGEEKNDSISGGCSGGK